MKLKQEKSLKLFLKSGIFGGTHSRIEQIEKVMYTIKRHWDGIIKWKESQINNGIFGKL